MKELFSKLSSLFNFSKENRLIHEVEGGPEQNETAEQTEKQTALPEDSDSAVKSTQEQGDKMGRHFNMHAIQITPRTPDEITRQEAIANKVGLKVEPGSAAHEIFNTNETIASIYNLIDADLPSDLNRLVRNEMKQAKVDQMSEQQLQQFANKITSIVDAYALSDQTRRDVRIASRAITKLYQGSTRIPNFIDQAIKENDAVASVFDPNQPVINPEMEQSIADASPRRGKDKDSEGTVVASVD